ncbi:hypothetical protein V2J60_11415 [Pseudomonas alliivorans]|nr:hypothetical protein [Pseudomonas alliivorans]
MGNVRAVICSALCIISTKGLRRRLLVEQQQLARRFLSSVSVDRAFTISLPCPALSYAGYSLLLPFYLALILMLCCGLFSVFAMFKGRSSRGRTNRLQGRDVFPKVYG